MADPNSSAIGKCLTCSRQLTELRQQAGDLFTRWVCVSCTTGASPPLYPYIQTTPAPPDSVTFNDSRDAEIAALRAEVERSKSEIRRLQSALLYDKSDGTCRLCGAAPTDTNGLCVVCDEDLRDTFTPSGTNGA